MGPKIKLTAISQNPQKIENCVIWLLCLPHKRQDIMFIACHGPASINLSLCFMAIKSDW